MFTEFFYTLRRNKVPVSVTEWMALMEALDKGYIQNLEDVYFLARVILVKSEAHFDGYDQAFQQYFGGVVGTIDIPEKILEWTKDAIERRLLNPDDLPKFEDFSFQEIMKQFEQRLREQRSRHDGGNRWIGTGGTSPFGNSGMRLGGGIRVGGESGGRTAFAVAGERRFRNYRNDMILDIRQTKLALRNLRQLTRIGPEDELDLDGTIDYTARNAGDIDLIWQRSRRNAARVLLLMDAGGSMDPHSALVSQLFSAAHTSNHFRDFQYYYFHNCVYHQLYKDIQRREAMSTDHLLKSLDSDYKLIMVGDAMMATWELTEPKGSIDFMDRCDTTGYAWLKRLSEHFTHCVWLNPYEDERFWINVTLQQIRKLIPMFPLTLDGLNRAVKALVVKR